MAYEIELTPSALEMLENIKDLRERRTLVSRIEKLREDPDKQGKALTGGLTGYRSVRAVGQRYRIVYGVDRGRVVVLVVVGRRSGGHKKDVYALLERLLEDG